MKEGMKTCVRDGRKGGEGRRLRGMMVVGREEVVLTRTWAPAIANG